MATDLEEMESALFLVHHSHKRLGELNPNHPLLRFISHIDSEGLTYNPAYKEEAYKEFGPNGQAPRDFSGRVSFLVNHYSALEKAIEEQNK